MDKAEDRSSQVTTMRDEFEAAVAVESDRPVAELHDERDGDSYMSDGLRHGWWAWQKSRETLVVALPIETYEMDKRYDGNYNLGWELGRNEALGECREAIATAGVTVKP